MAGARPIGVLAGRFDGRLDVLPPLTDEQLSAVPAKRGVFLLADGRGRAILLATAASIRGRLRSRLEEADPDERKRTADLRQITRRVHWALAGSGFEADWRYLEFARRIYPKRFTKLLSWKPAWFVHVDASEAFPHFVRTRDVFAAAGQYVGPFETGRAADRFIDVLQDAFDLCRDLSCLRRSPHGQRCAYGQMARCLCPCDGTMGMDAYRAVVSEAAGFAAGRTEGLLDRLHGRMRAAAAELRFEQAAAVKTRLDRLAELDGEPYRHVAPAGAFRFLMVQRSGSRRGVKVFLVDRGVVRAGPPLRWPLVAWQLRGAVRRMARFVAAQADAPVPGVAGRWRMGLVARLLFGGADRRGVVLRWDDGLDPDALAGAIEDAAAELGLARSGERGGARGRAPGAGG